jgi:AcrR family transcriptional regulator
MATRVGLSKATVIDAAAALADEAGLEQVTLASIAQRLGIRAPTLYHYFPGQVGLQRELALRGLRDLNDAMGHSVMGKSGDDAIRALAQAYRAFVKERPGLYAATVRAANDHDEAMVVAQTEVVDIALRALAGYHLTRDDAIHAVRMIRCIVHGTATLEVAGGFGIPLEVDETFRRLLDAFLGTLAAEARSTENETTNRSK